jgi:hypothetical protein
MSAGLGEVPLGIHLAPLAVTTLLIALLTRCVHGKLNASIARLVSQRTILMPSLKAVGMDKGFFGGNWQTQTF